VKPNLMANNTLKYRALDTATREKMREKWNKPLIWPLFALSGLIILMLLPAAWVYRRKKYKKMSVSLS
jgi:hypothetical protein